MPSYIGFDSLVNCDATTLMNCILQGTSGLAAEVSSFGNLLNSSARTGSIHFDLPDSNYVQTLGGEVNSNAQRRDSVVKGPCNSLNILGNDGLRSQDSFGRWINQIMTDSPGSVDDHLLDSSFIAAQSSFTSPAMEHIQSSVPEQIFIITDVSPSWAFSNEKTKVSPLFYSPYGIVVIVLLMYILFYLFII